MSPPALTYSKVLLLMHVVPSCACQNPRSGRQITVVTITCARHQPPTINMARTLATRTFREERKRWNCRRNVTLTARRPTR